MLLVALDPGKRTGLCVSEDYGFSLSYRAVMDQQQLCKWLKLIQVPKATIIYEQFMVYSKDAQHLIMQELWAPETIGMIKCIAWEKGWELVPQWASNAKSAANDAMLKQRNYIFNSQNVDGLNISDEVRHAKDAGRHMLYFVDFAPPKI